jgi:hypothetical protein
MLCGHWTQEWQKAYESTYQAPSEETIKDKKMAEENHTKMWGLMIALGTLLHNDKRHGWDKESRDRLQQEVLHYELEEIYTRKHQYPERVQKLLRTSYDLHIQETVTRIADWLDAYKGTFAVTWHPD